jgi:hypothetical protein
MVKSCRAPICGKSGIKSISYLCYYVVRLTAWYVLDLIYCDTVASVSCILFSSMNSVYIGTRGKSVCFKSLNNLISMYYEVTVQNGSRRLLITKHENSEICLEYFSWKLNSNTQNGIEIHKFWTHYYFQFESWYAVQFCSAEPLWEISIHRMKHEGVLVMQNIQPAWNLLLKWSSIQINKWLIIKC